jgi:hypothetical protein
MPPRKIDLDYTTAGFAALDAIRFGKVFRTLPPPRAGRPVRPPRPFWFSRTVKLTPAMDRVLDEVFKQGGIDQSRGMNAPVSLTASGDALWSAWDTEAMRRGEHPNQQPLPPRN